ncbi:MAG: polyprenyl synthetase family protein [Euryarchaeota archaeon]|nr:polyprenyl synthetase family protein [Euryarchaeota archaeon]
MDIIAEIGERAKAVDEQIMSYLEEGENQKLLLAVQHYPTAGGKRLRPVLAGAVAEAVGGAGKKAIPFGASLEIIHNFTLVHDDVMDNDSMRRGRPAVHVLFDVPTAIIAGDALFARAFEALSEVDVPAHSTRRLLKLTAHTVWLIAEGQQEDMDFERIPADELSIEDYERMVWKKTAVLFECAARGGAIIAGGTEEQIKAMGEYARHLGAGFQMWDDILALTGEEKVLGKPVGNDIRNGKRTLIVLHALHELKEDDPRRQTLLAALGNSKARTQDIENAIQALHDCGSIEYARRLALDHAAQGKKMLEMLEPGPDREFLSRLIDYSVSRKI